MYDVITVGTATRDVFLQAQGIKTLKDPEHLKSLGFEEGEAKCFAMGAKIDIDQPIFGIGGGATNAAVTFSRQGFKTAAVISIGSDQNGAEVKESLKNESIEPHISYSEDHGTGYSTLLLTPDGERTVLVYRGASNDLDLNQVPLSEFDTRWVYIVPSAIPFQEIAKIVDYLKAKGVKVAMNPSGFYLKMGAQKLSSILNKLDVVTMNRSEAASLTGVSYDDEAELFKVLNELVPGIIVMSEGPKGVLVANGGLRLRAGVFQEEKIADRTGAGDAFGSGFVASLAKITDKNHLWSEEDLREAIRLGSANATSVVEKITAQAGILTAEQYQDPRWQNLEIKPI
ncbi:MAG: hypothetical protein COU11_04325 [Candidatus Harrisonbacteria bacterium CG10_big_fil_rev_8_21_14_0_10_49_15]|uniref:Carbohydrate kinase PfkB domain-containing protein n=1 Tax=Candidatus Harrisonbacteria bacterium CG10_big_fil_rev_8_21_14_0_10_49_15 TaxID=1974587 RepID=A0A2H0UJX3_9BACT|nr:MAG: hypothetical protein COU11_04325 [Candidatus Harrisonbacteria bacterium CG10_big_fil_rev_8_21_14_0_10_49_15]